MPTAAQLTATIAVAIAKFQQENAQQRELVRKATLHYMPSELDTALGQSRN